MTDDPDLRAGNLSIVCPACRQPQRLPEPHDAALELVCRRCDTTLRRAEPAGAGWSLILTLLALVFYIPANQYPILRLTYLGAYSENTLIDGVFALWDDGM